MFPDILKRLRNEKNLTQTELAKVVGLDRTTIGKYENGDREPTIRVLIALADYFNVTLDYLCGR